MQNKGTILNFIKKHKLATLATSGKDGKPEAATIEFSETDELELIFDTLYSYRKYKNLKDNPQVAVVIASGQISVQYEGIAKELTGKELEKYQRIHIKKLPEAEKFVKMKGIKFFKIVPKWIRYTDVSVSPWKEFELGF